MVLNNDVKKDKSGTSILHIYGPGYEERYPMVAIIIIRLMFISAKYCMFRAFPEKLK